MELTEILSVVGGSLFGAVSTFFFQKKRENRDDFTTLVTEHKELYKQMKENYNETQARENKCEENLNEVRQQVEQLREELHKLKK